MKFNLLDISIAQKGKYIAVVFCAILPIAGRTRYLLYVNRHHSIIQFEFLYCIRWNNLKYMARKAARRTR